MKYILGLVLLGAVIFIGVKYGSNALGLYKANAPAKDSIAELLPVSGKTPKPGENFTSLPLSVPDGYTISVYAKDLGNPRDLEFDPSGILTVSVPGSGKVVAILNGEAELVAAGLNKPHGIAFFGNKLYVAETDGVKLFDYDEKDYKAFNGRKIIDLPGGGNHFTRSILIKDGKLYISVGSTCNICKEKDDRRAAIWWANLDGSDFRPYATGLRNSVFMALKPGTKEIWATEMGRDNLGDDIPPDEINIIQENQFYGWPYCWGDANADKDLNKNSSEYDCSKSINPQIKLQAHSAPLGLAFLKNDLLVAYHGSWNRSVPTGYKVVKFVNGKEEDFVTGWLKSGGEVLGRPADIIVDDKTGDIYISDDKAGVIYLLKPSN